MPAPSSTRLTAFCDGILEAGWLVALVVAPLYVNPFTSYNFEPPRALLITAVGLVMLLAWLLKGLEVLAARSVGRSRKRVGSATESTTWGRLLREPVVVIVALMALSVGVATVFSVATHVSLMGAYARGEGVYLIGTYVIVFASVGALVRTRAQVERVVSTALVVSLVVALYAILQHEGLDPMRWTSAIDERVQSTVGNTIFTGAFLMLMIPLSGYRILTCLQAARTDGTAGPMMGWVGVGVFTGCLIGWYIAFWVGVACTVVVLGMAPLWAKRVGQHVGRILPLLFYVVLAAMQVVGLVFTQSRGPLLGLLAGLFVFALLYSVRHRHRKAGWLVVGSAVAALAVLIVLNVPGTPLAFMKKVPYVERLSQMQSTSPTVRVRLLIWEAATDLATASPARLLLGHGPETMREGVAPFYPEGLDRLEHREALPDRAHNELFDVLVARGLVGVVLYLGFVLFILYYGLRRLGLVASARSRRGFWGATLSGIFGTALVVGLADHSLRLVGVGAALGLLGGLTLYLVGRLVGVQAPKDDATVSTTDLAVVSLLAAVVAYFVETQFGISVITTELFFWTFAALITLAGPRLGEGEAAAWPGKAGTGVGWIVGLAVGLLAFLFLGPAAEGRGAPLFMLLGLCALGGGAIVVLPETTPRKEDGMGILARFALTAGAVGGAYALVLLIVQDGGDGTPFVLVASVYVAVLVVLVGLGWRLHTPPGRAELTALRGIWRLAPLGVLALVVWLLVVASLDPMRAEVHASLSQQEARQERYDQAIVHLRRALTLSPKRDYYYWRLAQHLAAQARRVPGEAVRDATFREAVAALDALEALNPNNPEGIHERARLYLLWARATEDPAQRTERFQRADASYRQAVERIANKSVLWREWGDVGRGLDDTEAARRRYATAIQLDRTDAHSYAQLGTILRKEGDLGRAAEAFERALRHGRPTADLYLLLGTVRQQLGQTDEAIQAYAGALDRDSTEVGAHEALTRLYTQEGQCDDALKHAARLRDLQPNNFFYRVLVQQTELRCGQQAAADSTSGR